MDRENDKSLPSFMPAEPDQTTGSGQDSANRARNRTVMLTPEITGQVRALLNEDEEQAQDAPPPANNGTEAQEESSPAAPAQSQASSTAVFAGQSASAADQSLLVGFLVSFDENETGLFCELREGRWIISSEQSTSGNFIIVNDQTVSPLHAILRVAEDGGVQVLDQLSEHGTFIVRDQESEEEELTGSMSELFHGDTIRFGERVFHVCLIKRPEA